MDNEEMWVAESSRLHVFRTIPSRSTDQSPVFTHLKVCTFLLNLLPK